MNDYPAIHLTAGHARRLRGGHPWVFSNEVVMDAAAKALPPGGLTRVVDAGGETLGIATFNPHSLIALRMLTRDSATVDLGLIAGRIDRALALRTLLYDRPYYRLIHAEADGLPGLIIDRYGDVCTVQANTAGMERLLDTIVDALEQVVAPAVIVLKNDSPVRALEGLTLYETVRKGSLDGPVRVEENGATFLADLVTGQKTGWFYDQRDNRAAVAAVARGRRVIDFFSYAGGFAIQAARAGATHVTAVDRSEGSLALAAQAAHLNQVAVETVRSDCFPEMERLAAGQQRYGLVIADPPAFVKSKKDLAAGAKGYRKMARLAAALVDDGGFLFVASCSHHMAAEAFAEEIRHGLAGAGRHGRILRASGAGADHPVHPSLPASAYLKALLLQLD